MGAAQVPQDMSGRVQLGISGNEQIPRLCLHQMQASCGPSFCRANLVLGENAHLLGLVAARYDPGHASAAGHAIADGLSIGELGVRSETFDQRTD